MGCLRMRVSIERPKNERDPAVRERGARDRGARGARGAHGDRFAYAALDERERPRVDVRHELERRSARLEQL